MNTLSVSLPDGRSYDILCECGLLARCGELIRPVFSGSRIAVVADENVAALYGKQVLDALQDAGYGARLISFPAGEQSKSLATVERLYDALLMDAPFAVDRKSLIVALGGGVTGDLTGFVAATLLRGIPYVQIPTTLLAQVDSSVGGKVAVDLKQGKNLAGAFYQPLRVLIDPEALRTLSDRVFFDGMGEVIKYGVIRDEALFTELEQLPTREALMSRMEQIILRCCDCKRRVVEQDEHDTGERMLLNFGHTLGHVYEQLGGYSRYTHGESVCMGMAAILKIGEVQGLTACGSRERLCRLLDCYQLSILPDPFSRDEAWNVLSHDKKTGNGRITVVLAQKIGSAFLRSYPLQTLKEWL